MEQMPTSFESLLNFMGDLLLNRYWSCKFISNYNKSTNLQLGILILSLCYWVSHLKNTCTYTGMENTAKRYKILEFSLVNVSHSYIQLYLKMHLIIIKGLEYHKSPHLYCPRHNAWLLALEHNAYWFHWFSRISAFFLFLPNSYCIRKL